MKIRNKTFHKKVEGFVTASIQLLKNFASKGPIPVPPQLSFEEEEKPDFSLFVTIHLDDLAKLPEFVDCAKYILRNPTTRKAAGWTLKDMAPAKEPPLKLTHFRILYVLLSQHLKHVGKLSFVKRDFDKLYMDFEKYVYASKAVHKITTLLRGLSGGIDELGFGNGFKIRRISDLEKSAYERQLLQPFPFALRALDVLSAEYMLETIYSHRKGTPLSTSFYRKRFEDIVTTLRLFKKGRVGFDFIKQEAITWDPIGVIMYSGGGYRRGRIGPASYRLDISEKPDVIRLWRRFRSFRKTVGSSQSGRYINLALKRFNFGVEESNDENKIIDFFVAFEALYLPEKGELTYRLSNRIAILLGKNDEEAEKIREFMVRAYRVRSKIVHGDEIRSVTVEGKDMTLRDFAQRVEQYLRESLITFLILSKKHKRQKNIIALLDKSMISTKTRKLSRLR